MKTEQENSKQKVFVIGFDAVTFKLIKPLINEGKLPNFEKIINEGVSGKLFTSIPQFSDSAWTTFVTGVNPAEHGIFDSIQPKKSSYSVHIPGGPSRKRPALWQILSQYGKKVGIVNIPMTFPPEKVNGIFISGFDTPIAFSKLTYPKNLYLKITKAIGEYVVVPSYRNKTLRSIIEAYLDVIELRFKVVQFLLKKYQFDFFIVVFKSSDGLQHLCLKSYTENSEYLDAVKRNYIKYDSILGRLLDSLSSNTTVIVLSDHGAGPINKHVYLNKWLESQNLLKYRNSSKENHIGIRVVFNKQYWMLFFKKSYSLIKKYSPAVLRNQLKRYGKIYSKLERRISHTNSDIDWTHTLAYTCNLQGIYINLRGRQPNGIVDSGEQYDKICSKIIDGLYKIRDPDKKGRVVEKVYKKSEIFKGPYLDTAPDLYIQWKDDAYLARFDRESENNSIFKKLEAAPLDEILPYNVNEKRVATHTFDGIFIMRGNNVKKGIELFDLRLLDITPTILYLMGIPIPEYMEGKVITRAFESSNIKI